MVARSDQEGSKEFHRLRLVAHDDHNDHDGDAVMGIVGGWAKGRLRQRGSLRAKASTTAELLLTMAAKAPARKRREILERLDDLPGPDKVLKGLGTIVGALVRVLGGRTSDQISEVRHVRDSWGA